MDPNFVAPWNNSFTPQEQQQMDADGSNKIDDSMLLSSAAYGFSTAERNVPGYSILNDLTSEDYVGYKHNQTGKITSAFRGTNNKKLNTWRGIKRSYRDIVADGQMALDNDRSGKHFTSAERVTDYAIKKYGKENITLTGHSLGGSTALEVSKKYDLPAIVYNPFVHPDQAIQSWLRPNGKYGKAEVRTNLTDPVATFSPFLHTKKERLYYDTRRGPGLPQHALNPVKKPADPSKQKPPAKAPSKPKPPSGQVPRPIQPRPIPPKAPNKPQVPVAPSLPSIGDNRPSGGRRNHRRGG
jgi:hypothetical protein